MSVFCQRQMFMKTQALGEQTLAEFIICGALACEVLKHLKCVFVDRALFPTCLRGGVLRHWIIRPFKTNIYFLNICLSMWSLASLRSGGDHRSVTGLMFVLKLHIE